jgi:hypothetical protein
MEDLTALEEAYVSRIRERLSGVSSVVEIIPEQNVLGHINVATARGITPSKINKMKFYHLIVEGWGKSLEKEKYNLFINFDLTLSEKDCLDQAESKIENFINRQIRYKNKAASLGIQNPMEGEELLKIDHLRTDKDVLDFLVMLKGSKAAVIDWIKTQKEMHKSSIEAESAGNTFRSEEFKIDVDEDFLNIPICLHTRTISKGGKMVWTHGELFLDEEFSDAIIMVIPGKKVSEIISGTPIPDRIIVGARKSGFKAIGGDFDMSILELEPNNIIIKDWIEP